MKTDICEKRMNTFLSLDKNERIPADVTLHLLVCKKCRTHVHYLSLAEKYASEPIKASLRKTTLETVGLKPVSMAKWIICGILMILFMFVFATIQNRNGSESFSIVFYMIFGILVTVYCGLFVRMNLDFFIKKIEKTPHTASF